MNIIDSLVLTLGIDASGLEKGAKDATSAVTKMSTEITTAAEAGEKAQAVSITKVINTYINFAKEQKKTADSAVQNNKRIGASVESVAQSGEKVLRTFGALFLLFSGARSMKDFAADMVGVNASLGRTAQSIGQTPEALSGIGRAVERMGGSFNGALGGLKGLSDAFEQLRTTGNSAIMEPLARLQGASGKRITLGKDVHENFLQISEALKAEMAKDPAMADFLGRQIFGGDEGLTNLAKKGRAGVLADEAASPKITRQQTEDAQKLQAQLVAVRQGFSDIGNAILMDFGPALIKAAGWVKDLIDRNRTLIETKVAEWVKNVGQWFTDHKADIEAFGKAMEGVVTAGASLATAFASQSPAMQAMEAFAVLMGGRVLGAVRLVSGAMTALGAVTVPAWALAAMGISAAAQWQGAKDTAKTLGSDDPTKNDVVVDPESGMATKVGPGEGNQGTGPNTGSNPKTGAIAWFKSLFGFGGDTAKTKDNIEDTAKSTKGILDLMKAQKDGLGQGGMGAASGGGSGEYGGHSSAPSIRYGRQHKSGGGSGPVAPYKLTGNEAAQMGDGIRLAAKHLGIKPEDLGTVISYETGGTMDKWQSGPHTKWGHHRGLIQWGEPQAKQYGVTKDSTIGEQMAAVERYLRDAGVKPGMGIMDVYSAINAGHVGKYNASDRPGMTVRSHVEAMERSAHHNALARLDAMAKGGGGGDAAPSAAPAPSSAPAAPTSTMTEADALKAQAWINSLGVDHPMTAAEKAKLDSLQPQIDAYYRSKPAKAMDHQGRWSKPTDLRGRPVAPGPEVRGKARTVGDNVDPPTSPQPHTWGHVMGHALGAIARANALTRHDDAHPIPVTDAGAMKLQERTFGKFVGWGARHPDVLDLNRKMMHRSALDRMTRMASTGYYHHSVTDNRSDTKINGGIHVHTQATDAKGIAADIEPHLHRGQAAGVADYGLA